MLKKIKPHKFITTIESAKKWLDNYEIKNYRFIPDEKYGFKVNVDGDVYLVMKKLDFIPLKFNHIKRDFNCSMNNLTNLEFSPHSVGGDFSCYENQLITLKGCPQIVPRHFNCSDNNLTSLEFCPKSIGMRFNCANNKLINLEFFPQNVGGSVYCENNKELKEIQEIKDFKLIYQLHKEYLITKAYDKMNEELNIKSSSINKIKI